ncbi:hypothetical protein [Sulfitobacter sp. R18_1]|uniref:hypothetical protein n=1 Tax=Sulfitobacter sp. R18_1 TaxID=2821104 RepID=UPI001AD9B020|nr:hypothetical protein [Sulfitobacter sp. R18_1]MBO9428742.1 hypothetical protein [Sulfitobacter sp. R18_1]
MTSKLFPIEELKGADLQAFSVLTVSRIKHEADYLVGKALAARSGHLSEQGQLERIIDLRGKTTLSDADHDALMWYSKSPEKALAKVEWYREGYESEHSVPEEDMIAHITSYFGYASKNGTFSNRRLTIIAPATEEIVSQKSFDTAIAQSRAFGAAFILEMTPECFKLGEGKLQYVFAQCAVQLYAPQLDLWGFADLIPGAREDYTYTSAPKESALKEAHEKKLWTRFKAIFN